jgi:NAD-dependent dihydropyrimidine dehydrogenase PreA subunit
MMERLVYLRNVATLKLDADKCFGCGMCLEVCPHDVLAKNNGRVEIRDIDQCMECGACARNCPSQALTVRSGVGCAAAVINSWRGRADSSCCCIIEEDNSATGTAAKGPQCGCG